MVALRLICSNSVQHPCAYQSRLVIETTWANLVMRSHTMTTFSLFPYYCVLSHFLCLSVIPDHYGHSRIYVLFI